MLQSISVRRGILSRPAMVLWIMVMGMLAAPAVPATAATVTIEPIATRIGSVGTQAPGRPAGFTFFGESDVQLPVINASGDVVFRGLTGGFSGGDTFGIYLHQTGQPLRVLMDTTLDGTGNPAFLVPGQPAGTRFQNSGLGAPLLNNSGDVLFHARFFDAASGLSGSGLYATTTAGGTTAIVKIADTTDAVPGVAGQVFSGFLSGVSSAINGLTHAVLNDNGAVAFYGEYPGFQHGLYASSVTGATPIMLADTTQSVVPIGFLTSGGFRDIRPDFALSNTGIVAFHGFIGSSFSSGVFSVPVTGGLPQTVASRFDPVPGSATNFFSFDAQDINEAGQVLFQGNPTGGGNGLYMGDAAGGALSAIADTLGGFTPPGNDPTATFNGIFLGPLNESGGVGFISRITNAGNANSQGLYLVDATGSPVNLVTDTTQPAPGLVPAANLTDFLGFAGNTPANNDAGNLAFSAKADFTGGSVRGLYFFDACAGETVRIVDSTTSTSLLGSTFSTAGSQKKQLDLYQGKDAISGHYRGLNGSNDVAFLAQFSNSEFGIYVAHVQTGGGAGGGGTTITCPADAVVDCGSDTSPTATGSASAADSCSGASVSTTFTDVSVSDCGNTESITRTWTAGGSASCVQTISTLDTTAPALSLPANITIECDASTDPSHTGQATASDVCDAAPAFTFTDVITPDAACGQARVISRTWTATDACGNSSSAVQTITVVDTAAPTLTIPADVTVACGTSTAPSSTGQATIADNCDAAPTLSSSDSVAAGTCGQESVITRTWMGTDACGNVVSGVQTITVVDSIAPVLTVPATATVECDADNSPAATGSATAADNCDAAPIVTSSDSIAAGTCPQGSLITRTWTATDACGNTSSTVQTINVVDGTAPVVSLVGAGTVVLAGCVGDTYVELGATAADNCDSGPISVTVGGDTVDTSLPASFTISYNATDACGNAAVQVTRTVNVVDSSAPTFTSLPTDLSAECQGPGGVPATDPEIVSFLGMAAATDACDPIVGITHDAPVTFPFGPTTVTWTATDSAGNNFTDSRVVTVVDTTAPVVICPAAITAFADAACQTAIPDVTLSVTASDTCSDALALTASQSPAAGSFVTLGTHTITVNVADGSGNSGQCTVSVTVVDDTPPTVTPPLAATVECDQSSDPSATGSAIAADNCDSSPSVTFTNAAVSSTCPELSTITRTWLATDASGNAASADQAISVVDTTAPGLTCPATVSTSGGFGGTIVTFSPTASDACDPAPSVASAPPSGSFFATGVTSVTATATDTCTNAGTCSLDVLVSCFGVNRAKIGTKDIACRGIEEIKFVSMDGTEELISLFKAEEGSGGAEEDTLPASIVVDDGVNGAVTVDTSCGVAIQIGDVFGPYVVTDIEADFDDHADEHGNEVELKGSFVPAVAFDVATDAMVFTIDDGQGHAATFAIPAGSFQVDGKPSKGKLKFEGNVGVADVKAKLEGCKFKFKAKNATNTGQLVGTMMTVTLTVGPNVGTDTLAMEDKVNHLKFKREPKINCCPECVGVASMQVTSDQGVLVFLPAAGQSKLSANTVVDDGMNGAVTVHTSCSQALEAGMVVGPYTISEVIKIFH